MKNSDEVCSTFEEKQVEDLEECRALVNYIQSFYPTISHIVKEETNSNYPSGCYVYIKRGALHWVPGHRDNVNFGIYFNHAQFGSGESYSRPLCGKHNL